MRKNIYAAALAVLTILPVLLCGACSSGTMQEQVGLQEPVPLRIDARLDAGMDNHPASRASSTSSIVSDGNIVKLFLIDGGSNPGASYTNRYAEAYTYKSAASAWEAVNPIYVDARTANVYACYDPNNVVAFNNSTVTATDLKVQANADAQLWYYDSTRKNINNTNATLAFTLKCAYSRLSLKLSKSDKYTNACKVSRIVIKPSGGSFYTVAKVDIADGALSGSAVGEYSITTTSMPMYNTGLTTSPDESIDLLFPAQKLGAGAGLTFTLTVDGNTYSVTVPAGKFNEFKRGVRHTANLVMTENEAVMGSVTTADWPAATESNHDSTFD